MYTRDLEAGWRGQGIRCKREGEVREDHSQQAAMSSDGFEREVGLEGVSPWRRGSRTL